MLPEINTSDPLRDDDSVEAGEVFVFADVGVGPGLHQETLDVARLVGADLEREYSA